MKKLHKRLFAGLLACVSVVGLTLGLAACGEEQVSGPTTYSIQAPAQSDVYTLTGLPESAAEGDTVTFKVVLNDPENSSLGDIIVEPTFDLAFEVTPAADGTCTFTMPASPVEITVEATAYSEVLSDGALSLSSSAERTIAVNGSTETWGDPVWKLQVATSWNNTTSLSSRSYITSSNQSVIPDSAITLDEITSIDLVGSSGSNEIRRVDICIDTTNISAGTTWIELYLRSGNVSSEGTLMFKLTVVPEEQIEVEIMDVVFTFENTTDYATENIFFNITDVIGGEIMAVETGDFVNGEYTFEYAVGHSYRVTCSYAVYNENEGRYEDMTSLYLNEWVGQGVVGSQATNSLERDDENDHRYILTLTTEGIEVPLVITDSL